MSEQISSILVTLTVFNTSVAIYSNDLTKTKKHDIRKQKNMTLESTKTLFKNITIFVKHLKIKKHKNMIFILK